MEKHPLVKEVLYTNSQIDQRCKELAEEISKFYEKQKIKDNTVVMIGLLKGCIPFMANLLKYFTHECITEYMVCSSYLGGTKQASDPKINLDLNIVIKGKSVLIIEDIIDSGNTLEFVRKYLLFKGAKDVKIVTLVDKPEGRSKNVSIEPDWTGFTVKNEFLIGFGLDYEERLRNLPYIATCDIKKLDNWEW